MVSLSYFIKETTTTNIVFFGFQSLWQILSSRGICVYMLNSISNWCDFAAALSHCAIDRIDVCPFKVAWWWIYPPMCVKRMSCRAIFVPSDILGLIHVILFSKLILLVWITLSFSTLVMFRWSQAKVYWNKGSAFMLMPCDLNHCCISTYQQWMSPFQPIFLMTWVPTLCTFV